MDRKRILYIDAIEAISMFAVCFIHYAELLKPTYFDNFIDMFSFFGVACFFMANGALLLNKKDFDIKQHLKKMLHIFIVLFVWELISLIFFSVLYNKKMFTYKTADLISYFLGDIRWVLPTGHFWYIRALLSIYLLFPILKKCFDEAPRLLVIICISILLGRFIPCELSHIQDYLLRKDSNYIYISLNKITEYLPFGSYSEHLVYFILGGFLHKFFYLKHTTILHNNFLNRIMYVLFICIGGGVYLFS